MAAESAGVLVILPEYMPTMASGVTIPVKYRIKEIVHPKTMIETAREISLRPLPRRAAKKDGPT